MKGDTIGEYSPTLKQKKGGCKKGKQKNKGGYHLPTWLKSFYMKSLKLVKEPSYHLIFQKPNCSLLANTKKMLKRQVLTSKIFSNSSRRVVTIA